MRFLQIIITLIFTLTVSYAISLPVFYYLDIYLSEKIFVGVYIVVILFNFVILKIGKIKKVNKNG